MPSLSLTDKVVTLRAGGDIARVGRRGPVLTVVTVRFSISSNTRFLSKL